VPATLSGTWWLYTVVSCIVMGNTVSSGLLPSSVWCCQAKPDRLVLQIESTVWVSGGLVTGGPRTAVGETAAPAPGSGEPRRPVGFQIRVSCDIGNRATMAAMPSRSAALPALTLAHRYAGNSPRSWRLGSVVRITASVHGTVVLAECCRLEGPTCVTCSTLSWCGTTTPGLGSRPVRQ
jgi:hypothetical protein